MAIVIQCDFCNEYYTNRNDLRTIKIYPLTYDGFQEDEEGISKDICIKCYRAVKETLDRRKDKTDV